MSRRSPFLAVFFALLAVLGLAFVIFGVYFIALGNQARGWPSVEGEVIATAVRTTRLQSHTSGVSREERERLRRYYPEITYRWTVDGVSYTGSRYRLGTTHEKFETRQEAAKAAAKFAAGKPLQVFYDPASPASAVLETAVSGGVYAPLPIGLVFLACGLLGWRYRRVIAANAANAEAMDLP